MEQDNYKELVDKINSLENELIKEKNLNKILVEKLESEDFDFNLSQEIISYYNYLKKSLIVQNQNLEAKEKEINLILKEIDTYKNNLKLSETIFKAFFEMQIIGFAILDVSGNFININNKFASIFKYYKDELKNKNIKILYNDINYETDKVLFDHVHKGLLNSLDVERKLFRKDGTIIYVKISLRMFLNEQENKHYFGLIVEDLSETKNEIKKRQKLEERFLEFLENSPAFICAFDKNYEIYYANPALCKFMKSKREEIVGKKFYDFIKLKSNKDYALFRIRNLTPENPSETHDQIYTDKDGETKWQQWTNIAYFDENGNIIDYHSVGIDITDRKLYETSILMAKENAERSEKLKTVFLNQISSVIKEPFNTIITTLSSLKQELNDKFPNEFNFIDTKFDNITKNSSKLLRTIDLIIRLSELQTNSYLSQFSYINCKDILNEIYLKYKDKAAENALNFIFNFKSNQAELFTDKIAFYHIFYNLIDNAIKFTKKGSVIIEVRDIDETKLLITIIDTGIGMSEDYQKIIYSPFSQEKNEDFDNDGIGLGLALTKLYIDVINADISFKSTKNKGTEFNVIFYR